MGGPRTRHGVVSVVLLLSALAVLVLSPALVEGWLNPGTPQGVPASFDCAVREFAWEYGKHLLPDRGEFRTLFDALQLQVRDSPWGG